MSILKFVPIMVIALIAVGCSKKASQKMVGKWKIDVDKTVESNEKLKKLKEENEKMFAVHTEMMEKMTSPCEFSKDKTFKMGDQTGKYSFVEEDKEKVKVKFKLDKPEDENGVKTEMADCEFSFKGDHMVQKTPDGVDLYYIRK